MIRGMERSITTLGLGIGLVLVGGVGAARAELKVGDKAPAFELQGSDGKTYSLEQFKGKSAVVIAWFPKAFTGGCTKECKSLRANSKALHELDVAYFTASVDTPEENKKFAESLDLDYPILSDPDKSVAKAYGVLMSASPLRQSLDVLHRQGWDHQGDRQVGENRQRGYGRRHQGQGPGTLLQVGRPDGNPLDRRDESQGRCWARSSAQCRSCTSAHIRFSSPRIFQNSRLCIRPGTRRHDAGCERLRLGVLEVVRDLVQEGVEQLVQGPAAFLAIVGVDAHQSPRPVIAPQHARGGPGVDVDDEGDAAAVHPLQPIPEQRGQGRDGGLDTAGAPAGGWAARPLGPGGGLGSRPEVAGQSPRIAFGTFDRGSVGGACPSRRSVVTSVSRSPGRR